MIASLGRKIASNVSGFASGFASQNPQFAKLGRSVSKSARDFGAHLESGRSLEPALRAMSNRKIQAAGISTIAAGSFIGGIDSNRQVSNSFFDLTTGTADYDNYVLGRDVGVRGLFAPLPGERMFRQSTIQPGTVGGGLVGGLAGLKLRGLKGGIVGGLAGGIIGQSAFVGATGMGSNAVLTTRTYTDAHRQSRKRTPTVDGSMTFGMYNARLG